MPTHIYLAPAAAGKTAYVLNLVRKTARDLATRPRVVVPTHLQARAARRRLAEIGGAIGVRVLTFDQLYADILNIAGLTYTELSEPVQYRLIRAVVDTLSLRHFAPLADLPGFIAVLQRLIGELKAARVHPDAFHRAVQQMGGEPRLAELAAIYTSYQSRLQERGWADRAGLGWLAVEALEHPTWPAGAHESLLAVDGFDSFTPAQIALLRALVRRTETLIITLTGALDDPRGLAHERFTSTRRDLEEALGVQAAPLPFTDRRAAAELIHIERHLFGRAAPSSSSPPPAGDAIALIEASDRAAEVRAALRWLKERLLLNGCRPHQFALLARNMAPYRPFIQQVASEFGLPIRLTDGLPLAENPAVAALLSLLQIMTPAPGGKDEPALPHRPVVAAWRSPYFDWSALPFAGASEPVGISPGDADTLDAVARWGRVLGGLAQWSETLAGLAARPAEVVVDEDRNLPGGVPGGVPRGEAAALLRARFDRFVARLTPPAGRSSYRELVGWLEALIGPDTAPASSRFPVQPEPAALQIVARAASGERTLAERDLAALAVLKDVLRGLVWAEEALSTPPVEFARFLTELIGVVESSSYQLPIHADREEILVADVVQARGLPFRAVAVLGLGEGEFPATLVEDPFLRDADRLHLRQEFDLPLALSTESAEAEFFYETVTRPSEWLLLTRPRLADNGAPWQASPYWEDVHRLAGVTAKHLTSESAPAPDQVASWPELLESLAALANATGGDAATHALAEWALAQAPAAVKAVEAASQVLQARRAATGTGPFEGDLTALAGDLAMRFGPGRPWSASRLEAYRSCPFHFFVAYGLGLAPRDQPVEGLDSRQLGNIYHSILERVYAGAGAAASSGVEELLAALPAAAAAVLDAAPELEGFRVTAWWLQTRREIEENVRRSIVQLAALPGDFTPAALEVRFFGGQAVDFRNGEDSFRLHGVIDRVDQAPDGRLRVIDYKTGSPAAFTNKAVLEGKKLQIPLYGIAAAHVLSQEGSAVAGASNVVDGFYWHVQRAEASPFSLAKFDGGPDAAMETALAYAWDAVHGARGGQFAPEPPDEGCPQYCPAAGFCWRFRPWR